MNHSETILHAAKTLQTMNRLIFGRGTRTQIRRVISQEDWDTILQTLNDSYTADLEALKQ
jgi:hypothetical protein